MPTTAEVTGVPVMVGAVLVVTDEALEETLDLAELEAAELTADEVLEAEELATAELETDDEDTLFAATVPAAAAELPSALPPPQPVNAAQANPTTAQVTTSVPRIFANILPSLHSGPHGQELSLIGKLAGDARG